MSAMKQPRNEWEGMLRHLSAEEFAAEVAFWMCDYQALLMLEAESGASGALA